MSETAINVLAIAIFLMTLSVLLGPMIHLSPLIPSVMTLTLLGLVTVDQLGWQGQGTKLLLGSFATKSQRQRVLYHEAGHFLMAYLMGIPIQDYSLSAWEAFRKGRSGQGGVEFVPQDLTEPFKDWQQRPLLLERWAMVYLAGIAAEQVIYGQAVGGQEDRQQLYVLFQQAGLPPSQYSAKESWALLQAKNRIQEHRPQYELLVQALADHQSVEVCYQRLQGMS